MDRILDVTVRREGRVSILETNGYIYDTEAEKIAEMDHTTYRGPQFEVAPSL